MNYYYLYIIKFEDGRFYIGSRLSKVPANEDVNYWGSPGKTIKHLWEMKKEKHIFFESTDISLQDLREKEYEMIQEGWKKYGKSICVNKNAGGLNHLDLEVVKKTGKKIYEQKLGFFAWTPEEWSKNAKEKWHSNKNARGFMSWDEEKINEFREEQRKKKCNTYNFFDPNGNEVIVDDLPTFCKKNNLIYSKMIAVHKSGGSGGRIHHKGWSTIGPKKVEEILKIKKNHKSSRVTVLEAERLGWNYSYYFEPKTFYDPSGKKIIIRCYTAFATKHNLNPQCLYYVYKGELLQHKGYSVLHPDEVKKRKKELGLQISKRRSKIIKLRNPDGDIVEIENLVGYCRDNGLNAGNMHNVLSGKVQSCMGWTSAEKNIKPDELGVARHFKFRNPEGKIVEIYNLAKYVRENKLDPEPSRAAKALSSVWHGRVNSWRGWTKVEETEIKGEVNLMDFMK